MIYNPKIILKRTGKLIARESVHWYPPGFNGFSVHEVGVVFFKQIRSQSLRERAAAIAYNFIMAIPPSLLFLFTLIPNLPFFSTRSVKQQLHKLIFDIIPSPAYNKEVIAFVDSFIDGSKIGLISVSFLLSLFFASNAMMGLMRSFNKKYEGFIKRKDSRNRWLSIKITIILFGLLLAYLVLLISQGALLKIVVENHTFRNIIEYSRWLFIFLLLYFVIAFIYKYAPAVPKKWKIVSPGTVLATFLSILASAVFSYIINHFGRLNALYGSIGTAMMVMALIYINAFALLIGFELNVALNILNSKKEASSA
ncbi:MAG: YihY/virulence factor BrkB family protein [Bacteroidetes bacterium]|nr:YihY/virulence factor BrkB family protein [Bacteroidota bacterium]